MFIWIPNAQWVIATAIVALIGVGWLCYTEKTRAAAIAGLTATITVLAMIAQHKDVPPLREGGQLQNQAQQPQQQAQSQAPQQPQQQVQQQPSQLRSDIRLLPVDSPLRHRIIAMEDACTLSGQALDGMYAWSPGQQSADSDAGRTQEAPGIAFEWSCTQGGPKLTQAEITRACQAKYGPGHIAYTNNPNHAYSWFCTT